MGTRKYSAIVPIRATTLYKIWGITRTYHIIQINTQFTSENHFCVFLNSKSNYIIYWALALCTSLRVCLLCKYSTLCCLETNMYVWYAVADSPNKPPLAKQILGRQCCTKNKIKNWLRDKHIKKKLKPNIPKIIIYIYLNGHAIQQVLSFN